MQRAALFHSIAQQREPEPRIELVHSNTGARLTIDAASLIAQYRVASGETLLILDEDCPYEEQVHLVLVRDNRVADHLVLGAPYATGIYRELGCEEDALRFGFAGDAVFTLRLAPAGASGRLPRGARRRGGWFARHYLELTVQDAA